MEEVWTMVEDKWKYILLMMIGVIVLLVLFLVGKVATAEKETAPVDVYEELLAEEVVASDSSAPSKEIEEVIEEEIITEIMVDVKGAVVHPGVYKMQSDDRIIDAIQMAGGLISTAEERSINFAQILEDQMVIYVPEVGDEDIEIASSITHPENEDEAEKIDINTADKNTLITLNGIGPSKADAIIRYREESGFFKTIEDIKEVSGIGDATFENVKDFICVSP